MTRVNLTEAEARARRIIDGYERFDVGGSVEAVCARDALALVEEVKTLQAVVEALPRCSECAATAIASSAYHDIQIGGSSLYCAAHADDERKHAEVPELPYAAALRALDAGREMT